MAAKKPPIDKGALEAKKMRELEEKQRAQSAAQEAEAWKNRVAKRNEQEVEVKRPREMRSSETYKYDVGIYELKKKEEVRGLLELSDLQLNSMPNSAGNQTFGKDPITEVSGAYAATELQNNCPLGRTKFFMDAKGRVVKVRRTR
jgi:hypothetical protein